MKRTLSILLATAMIFVLIAAPVYAVRTRSSDYNIVKNNWFDIAQGAVRCHIYSDYTETEAFAETYLGLSEPGEKTLRAMAAVTVYYTNGAIGYDIDNDERVGSAPGDGAAAYPEEVYTADRTPISMEYEHWAYVDGVLEYEDNYSAIYNP